MKDSYEVLELSPSTIAKKPGVSDGVFGSINAPAIEFRSSVFWVSKRAFDIGMSLVLLPLLVAISLIIAILNPFFNKGPLLFLQIRMGRGCQPFTAVKFRTMKSITKIDRGPNDPLETSRITRLGHFLRQSRIDELPQILNVLKGEMSLIGPRPDYWGHAVTYVKTIPRYALRHQIRPGISGLAQTRLGYIEGMDATRQKVTCDLIYIRKAGIRMEVAVFVATVLIVLNRGGR